MHYFLRVFLTFFRAKLSANSRNDEFEDTIFEQFWKIRKKEEAAKLLKVWVCGNTFKSRKPQNYGKYGFAATPKPQSYKKYEFQDDFVVRSCHISEPIDRIFTCYWL